MNEDELQSLIAEALKDSVVNKELEFIEALSKAYQRIKSVES